MDPSLVAPSAPRTIRVGNLEIRPAEMQVLVDGRRAGLTVREFQIFWALAERRDRVVTREEIYRLIWDGRLPRRNRSVDVFVRKVRVKLEKLAPECTYIHTHFGIGYRFYPEPISAPSAPSMNGKANSKP